MLFSVEGGYLVGRQRAKLSTDKEMTYLTEVVEVMFGLLIFLLAFTFSLAASRFENRKLLVMDEANALGTAIDRAGMLPEPNRPMIRKLLREYLEVRVSAVQSGEVTQGVSRSEQLQREIWVQTEAAADKDHGSIVTGLFITSLNEVFDLHAKRVMLGLRSRMHAAIWATLYFLSVCALGTIGYEAGLASGRVPFTIVLLAFMFSIVLLLIIDLDLPQAGMFTTSQQPLVELLNSLDRVEPGGK